MGVEGDRSLVAGRSQREKRRSYKDLLREEEEIAAQVRKSSKKRLKVRPPYLSVVFSTTNSQIIILFRLKEHLHGCDHSCVIKC